MFKNRLLYMGLIGVVSVMVVKYLLPYFTPFIIGLVLAAVLDPLIDRLERQGWRRSVVSLTWVLVVFGGLTLVLGLALVGLVSEIEQLMTWFTSFYDFSSQWLLQLEQFSYRMPSFLVELVPKVNERAVNFMQEGLLHLMESVTRLPNLAFTLLVAALTTYFLCRDKRLFGLTLYRLMPGAWKEITSQLKKQVIQGLFGYFRAQFILMAISACLSVMGFFVLKIPYAWLLGLLAGFFDLIPMIGPSGVFIPLLIYYSIMELWGTAVLIVLLWMIVLIVRQLWEPHILGSQLGLHPLTSIVAIYLGVRWLGFSGFFMGPLIMIFCKALFVVLVTDEFR